MNHAKQSKQISVWENHDFIEHNYIVVATETVL